MEKPGRNGTQMLKRTKRPGLLRALLLMPALLRPAPPRRRNELRRLRWAVDVSAVSQNARV